MYCKKCGGKVESYASHCPFCGEAMSGNDVTATYTKSAGAEGAANKSIGGWILTYIIMGIPLVGFIMMFVWAFGEKTKADPTFRNWARTALLLTAISVVLSVVCVLIVLPALEGMLPEIPA